MTTATIALLLKNAEPYLQETLDAIQNQRVDFSYEVIAIDSGSIDKTLEILSSYPVRVIKIDAEEFNHGETRNLAARESATSSKYIVYLTQDARPLDEHWLQELLNPFNQNTNVAGVYSKHIPRPHTSVSSLRQLTTLTQTGGEVRLVKELPGSIDEYESNQLYYVYFSNTSSAIRKDIWKKFPFDRVDFAEDAVWADNVLRAGYTLIFEPKSEVLHSHDYGPVEQFRQNVDHAYAMNSLFHPPSYHDSRIWFRLFFGIPLQVWRDFVYLRKSEYTRDKPLGYKISSMVKSPFWHIATVCGGWIGAHLENMPPTLKRVLSRQERLKLNS